MIGRAGKLALTILMGAMCCARAQTPGAFTATGSMTTARLFHTATLLQDGRVLIAGGSGASAELYDPMTGKFTRTGNMIHARSQHTATLLPNGTVLITGGDDGLGTAELYDSSTGKFSLTTGRMNSPRYAHVAALLPDGRVLIAAGYLTAAYSNASAELYDPATGAFTPAGTLLGNPYGTTTATSLADGRVLIAGGIGALYDPRTSTFSFPEIPGGHVSTALLMNGRVLFAGGNDDPGDSNLAELYDPSTGTVTPTGNMTAFRADDPATLLTDGTVLIAGDNGDAGLTLASAELYDPATGTFTRTGDMTADRGLHTATLLNNGKVLITGGIHYVPGQGWPALSSADLYTPASVIPAPVLFSLSGNGQGQGAIWHSATGEIASAGNPGVVGEALSMYTNSLTNGALIPPRVIIGGRLAEILYFGAAPGYPGYFQVNFQLPPGIATGAAIPVHLTYLDRTSNSVTIGVR